MPDDTKSVIITPSAEEIDWARGYRITLWNTYKNYECVHCQYASLFLEKINKHLEAGEHPWAYPGQNPPELDADNDEPVYE